MDIQHDHPPEAEFLEELLKKELDAAKDVYHAVTTLYRNAVEENHSTASDLATIQSNAFENYRTALKVFNNFILSGVLPDGNGRG